MKKIKIERANTFYKRFMGLMGRSDLDSGNALLIAPCNSIHMMFMRFAIDAVFIDKAFRIQKIVRNLKPWLGFASCLGAWAVVELKAGEATRLKLEVGQIFNADL